MNTFFFVGLDKLLCHRRNPSNGLTAMVTPGTHIHTSVVMLPVPVSATGRRQKLAPRPVRDQHLGYKAYLLFGVSKASVPAERSWARDAMCSFFR
jgi:hypothetical protein